MLESYGDITRAIAPGWHSEWETRGAAMRQLAARVEAVRHVFASFDSATDTIERDHALGPGAKAARIEALRREAIERLRQGVAGLPFNLRLPLTVEPADAPLIDRARRIADAAFAEAIEAINARAHRG